MNCNLSAGLSVACLITAGCCSNPQVAEVYANSNPTLARVWNLEDGHSFGQTPSSTYIHSSKRFFGLLKPKDVKLRLVFEEDGYGTVIKDFKVTNWEIDEAHARLNSNKIQIELHPLK